MSPLAWELIPAVTPGLEAIPCCHPWHRSYPVLSPLAWELPPAVTPGLGNIPCCHPRPRGTPDVTQGLGAPPLCHPLDIPYCHPCTSYNHLLPPLACIFTSHYAASRNLLKVLPSKMDSAEIRFIWKGVYFVIDVKFLHQTVNILAAPCSISY